MAGWQKSAVVIGALLAIIAQWWGMDYYLSVIGGVLVLLGTFVK